MRIRSFVPLTAGLLACLACSAQSALTPQSIEAQLQGPFLMLRGMYDGHKLDFDAQGNLVGRANLLPFSLSALRLDKVKVTDSAVEIDTTREGLDFQYADRNGTPRAERWGRGNRLRVFIARDAQHPQELDAAIAKVFSIGIDRSLIESAPECWRPYLQGGAGPSTRGPSMRSSGAVNGSAQMYAPGGPVAPPRLLFAPAPIYPREARDQKYTGIAVIGLIVDATGAPKDVHVVRALGMGLDEAGVEAVEHYLFTPAMYDGKPVPVQINIEVNFRIW